MPYGVVLAKLLPAIRAPDFLCGNLYLNTLSYFNNADPNDRARHDPYEGIHAAQQFKEIAIKNPESGQWVPISGAQSPLGVNTGRLAKLNVLCFYMITDRACDSFHPDNLLFGDTAIVVTDVKSFMSRIKRAVIIAGKTTEVFPVEYVEQATHNGLMGPFRKFHHLRHQNELRVLLTGGDGGPCRLEVGDLSDITSVIPSAQLPQLWQYMLAKGV